MKFLKLSIWYILCRYVFFLLPSEYAIRLVFLINNIRLSKKHYKLNFSNPRTFNEKINFLKLRHRNNLIPIAADKVSARDYVSKTIGVDYLVPLIGIYDSIEQIIFDELPEKFVLKSSHGCGGMNLICQNKSEVNWRKEKFKFKFYQAMDTNRLSREWHYNKEPKLICENLLSYDIVDYKFFCNNGSLKAIQVDLNRFTNHKRYIMNSDWEPLNFQIRYETNDVELEKPVVLDEMIRIAKKLSSPFIFSRVDLYIHNEKIYFGEITFHPGGGTESFTNYMQDLAFGNLFSIKKNN